MPQAQARNAAAPSTTTSKPDPVAPAATAQQYAPLPLLYPDPKAAGYIPERVEIRRLSQTEGKNLAALIAGLAHTNARLPRVGDAQFGQGITDATSAIRWLLHNLPSIGQCPTPSDAAGAKAG